MFANPDPTTLTLGVSVTVRPVGSQMTRPGTVILTNSSAFTLEIQTSSGLVRFLPAWTADAFKVDPNNPYITAIPQIGLPTSTPYDRSLYVSWVGANEQLPASYPQSVTPNVLQAQPTGTAQLNKAITVLVSSAGTFTLINAPGVGNSLYINTVRVTGFTIGTANTTGSIIVQDGTGTLLIDSYLLITNQALPGSPVPLNGFELGDNKRLDIVVSVPAGTTTTVFLATVTYSVGVTQ